LLLGYESQAATIYHTGYPVKVLVAVSNHISIFIPPTFSLPSVPAGSPDVCDADRIEGNVNVTVHSFPVGLG